MSSSWDDMLPFRAGMSKSLFNKLPPELRTYVMMGEGVRRATPHMPRTYRQAVTLLNLIDYFNRDQGVTGEQ